MRRIVVCADDYGLSPGVSKAIRELLAMGRLNATSVMTVFPDLAEEAKALLAMRSPIPFQIGLHVALTGGFTPLRASPIEKGDRKLPVLDRVLPPFGFFRIDRTAVEREVSAQIEKFTHVFGRAPDYIDGHQHVQLMPGIRATFLETMKTLAPNAWVRQCGAAKLSEDFCTGGKTRSIAVLNFGFLRHAKRLGIKTNPAFTGAYNYSPPSDFAPLFAKFVAALPEGGVMMCHPGHVDEVLCSRDMLTDQREREFAFLASDQMPRVLAEAGARLA